jgi:hypothetical protein
LICRDFHELEEGLGATPSDWRKWVKQNIPEFIAATPPVKNEWTEIDSNDWEDHSEDSLSWQFGDNFGIA